MNKSTFFTGQPVFNQILHLVPRHVINAVTKQNQSDRKVADIPINLSTNSWLLYADLGLIL